VWVLLVLPSSVLANHAWGNYHWARTANPFTLLLGDNVSSTWDDNLVLASADWSQSDVLNTVVTAGAANPKNCRATRGRVEVCNSKYGNNGWLGVAQIWASGDHITQGTVKLNDTYFNTPTYNTEPWRQLVVCQEVGHTFGLDHQDENFNNANLGTCMDYTSDPSSNQHPNAHDYDELDTIYSHLDSTTTVGTSSATAGSAPSGNAGWGRLIARSHDGRTSAYMLRSGRESLITFVIWA
jgi:hypothetical protein